MIRPNSRSSSFETPTEIGENTKTWHARSFALQPHQARSSDIVTRFIVPMNNSTSSPPPSGPPAAESIMLQLDNQQASPPRQAIITLKPGKGLNDQETTREAFERLSKDQTGDVHHPVQNGAVAAGSSSGNPSPSWLFENFEVSTG